MTSITIRSIVRVLNKQTLRRQNSAQILTGCQRRWLLVPPSLPEEKTMQEVVHELTQQVIGGPNIYDPKKYVAMRGKLVDSLPSSQDELPARRMLDSYDMAVIPLGSDPKLRDRYLTIHGGVRIGRLLENMDIFAVHLVFKHILNPRQEVDAPSPFSIVTALVDKIDITREIRSDCDIRISGHVTWVGSSSAEATLCLHQKVGDIWTKVTEAVFVMVARHPLNTGGAVINSLDIVTEEEKEIFNIGLENKNRRQAMKNESLFSHPPTEDEKSLIHDFFIKTVDHKQMSFKARIKPENSVWFEDAKLKNLLICQPENRNRFNKIFGGFIMRQAFELAWANAYVYGGKRPYCLYMDDIWFRKPVEIGSLLYFNSQICYTTDKCIQTRVSAEILNPETGAMSVTNVFQYTFEFKDTVPRQIIPKTYHEAMMYLEGRRHYQNSLQGIDYLQ